MKSLLKNVVYFCLIYQSIGELLGFTDEELKRAGYGTEWVYFPDGNGLPRFVNLTMPDNVPLLRSDANEVEYRFNSRDHTYTNDTITLDGSGRSQYVDEDVIRKSISNKLVKVITHGWMSSADSSVVVDMTDAYLYAQDVIVIAVNWGDTAKHIIYSLAAQATADIGSQVGQFLVAFCDRYKVRPERLHLIGHSLGAHVMGIAGLTSGLNVGRITGLDPARPHFEWPIQCPLENRLDSSDAQFVDVIHTCAGFLGYQNPIGHADYFPNNGLSPQPGCPGFLHILADPCSHSKSHEYFKESIYSPAAFPVCRNETNVCHPETYMGESANPQALGVYYLKTNSNNSFDTSQT